MKMKFFKGVQEKVGKNLRPLAMFAKNFDRTSKFLCFNPCRENVCLLNDVTGRCGQLRHSKLWENLNWLIFNFNQSFVKIGLILNAGVSREYNGIILSLGTRDAVGKYKLIFSGSVICFRVLFKTSLLQALFSLKVSNRPVFFREFLPNMYAYHYFKSFLYILVDCWSFENVLRHTK